MARRGLWYQLEKCLAGKWEWNRKILCLERSWLELIRFLEKNDTKKKR